MDFNKFTEKALEKYGRDLTDIARRGKLTPVVDCDKELRCVIQVLLRRTKKIPVLIGEPGVIKTAIVEGLAQRIVKGNVPQGLKNKRLVALDLQVIVSGCKYRGDFEQMVMAMLREITESEGNIILFIDELHKVIGAGAALNALDASSMLKPMLAAGELHCIGATTLDEYRNNIENDTLLGRLFQPVMVVEPTVEETIGILRVLRGRYEAQHGLRIKDTAMVTAAVLSQRYISYGIQPDKAMNLVDEASSRLRMEIDGLPAKLDEMQYHTTHLEVERQALKRESDRTSKERLADIEKELADLKEQGHRLRAQWEEKKKGSIGGMERIKEQIKQAKVEVGRAELAGDLEKVARVKYGSQAELEKKLKEMEARLANTDRGERMLKEEVDEEDIAGELSDWTGVPVSKLMEGEVQKLLKLEQRIRQRVVGQDEALNAVSSAIRRAWAGLQDPNRPLGSFIFLGPTGVGKTELARALAEFLFDDEQAIISLDMSDYTEKYTVWRLTGAPPGYVGYDEGGHLTEAVRRRPYSVTFFDEVEKAHADVRKTLLQIMEDGRLADGHRRTVDFKNTVVIMTSNLGRQWFAEVGPEHEGEVRQRVMDALRAQFGPGFLDGVDEVVIFHSLGRDQIMQIVDIQMTSLRQRLEKRHMTVDLTEAAKEFLVSEGSDPDYGAKPLKRTIKRRILDPLAFKLLDGTFTDGDRIIVDARDDGIVFEKAKHRGL